MQSPTKNVSKKPKIKNDCLLQSSSSFIDAKQIQFNNLNEKEKKNYKAYQVLDIRKKYPDKEVSNSDEIEVEFLVTFKHKNKKGLFQSWIEDLQYLDRLIENQRKFSQNEDQKALAKARLKLVNQYLNSSSYENECKTKQNKSTSCTKGRQQQIEEAFETVKIKNETKQPQKQKAQNKKKKIKKKLKNTGSKITEEATCHELDRFMNIQLFQHVIEIKKEYQKFKMINCQEFSKTLENLHDKLEKHILDLQNQSGKFKQFINTNFFLNIKLIHNYTKLIQQINKVICTTIYNANQF